jgi:Mor family transcriptional regulator
MSAEKVERNKQIVKDKKNGMSWTDLIIKYNMSYTALYKILKRYKAV